MYPACLRDYDVDIPLPGHDSECRVTWQTSSKVSDNKRHRTP